MGFSWSGLNRVVHIEYSLMRIF